MSAGYVDDCLFHYKPSQASWYREWAELGFTDDCFVGPSGRGGKTECRIYQVVDAPNGGERGALKEVATAEAVCSWRDQFSRRAGRLYSLALALCDMEAGIADRWRIYTKAFLSKAFPNAPLCTLDNKMVVALQHHDRPAVKAICAEIVEAWKHPVRARTHPTPEQIEGWRAEARQKHGR